MKFKTIKGLCNYLAQSEQQDKIQAVEKRFIFNAKDFNEKDLTEIQKTCEQLQYTIKQYDTTTTNFNDFKTILLKDLQKITPHLFYGFQLQDEIISHLKNFKGD